MDDKTRTITLTGRAPVRIVEAEWPVIARADDDSFKSIDYARHSQAKARGEIDVYHLIVRQHSDGRSLVYGVLTASSWTGTEDWKGGELLEPGADLAAAIERVGSSGELPDSLIRECIADLPAEDI